jgi:hypothetical protein
MRFVVIVVCILSFFGCQMPINVLSEKELAVNKILYDSAMNIKKETGLVPFGSGGQMMDQVKELTLLFLYHQPVDVDKARELLVTASETLLKEINSDERVRPYLDCYPFEPKNITIKLIIQKLDGESFGQNELCIVSTDAGKVEYKIDGPDPAHFVTIKDESYEEARQKLQCPRLI